MIITGKADCKWLKPCKDKTGDTWFPFLSIDSDSNKIDFNCFLFNKVAKFQKGGKQSGPDYGGFESDHNSMKGSKFQCGNNAAKLDSSHESNLRQIQIKLPHQISSTG